MSKNIWTTTFVTSTVTYFSWKKSKTRGHNKKIKKLHCRLNPRHYYFSQRVTDWWNKLPKEVINTPSVDSFKNRLNHHFRDHFLSFQQECFTRGNMWDKASNVKNRKKHRMTSCMHVGQGVPTKVSYRPPVMIDHRTLDDMYHSLVACNNPPGHTFESPKETPMCGLVDCSKPLCLSYYLYTMEQLLRVNWHVMDLDVMLPWASYQIRKIAGCACAGNARNVFLATDFKGNR